MPLAMTPVEHLTLYTRRVLLMTQRYTRRYADRLMDARGQAYGDDCVGRAEVRRLLGIAFDGGGQGWLDELGVAPLPAIDAALSDETLRLRAHLRAHADADGVDLPIEALRARFDLSDEALDLLIAAALPQLSPDLSRLMTFAWADFNARQPTVSFLAELVCAQPARLGATLEHVEPDAPLIRHRLLILHPHARWGAATPRVHSVVEVPQRVLDFLLGDRPGKTSAPGCTLHTAHSSLSAPLPLTADSLVIEPETLLALQDALRRPRARVALLGPPGSGRRTLLRALCPERPILEVDLERALYGVRADDEVALQARLSEVFREACLHDAVTLLRLDATLRGPLAQSLTRSVITARLMLQALPQALVLCAPERDVLVQGLLPDAHVIHVHPPRREGQRELWRRALSPHLPDAHVDAIAEAIAQTYRLSPGAITQAVEHTVQRSQRRLHARKATALISADDLFAAIRQQIEHRLGHLAEPHVVHLDFDEVVLTGEARSKIDQILQYARNAERVFNDWGFAHHSPQGRGLSVLFSGPPGTGKTLVAGVLARALGRALYRVDLSRIVDKYIGETEKNLAQVFDEAERAQAILLFDEADSLFAKRTAVKSSNDRYANLEVNFLLQRLESFDGISILTTNFVTSIDEAFQRRIRFKVEFPMPDAAERAQLWRRLLPPQAPISSDVDFSTLGERFEISGGHIRNAVLRAAMSACDAGTPLTNTLLFSAAVDECREMGGLITDVTRGSRAR
jgi:ATP-dependent 26S proteasome regulatory subunit